MRSIKGSRFEIIFTQDNVYETYCIIRDKITGQKYLQIASERAMAVTSIKEGNESNN